jgi:hypothetical protein
VHVLNPAEDAISQISKTLLGREGIESLHIVSHGEAGELQLGQDWLTLYNLQAYREQLQSWQGALTQDADILLYGCNVGEGELGQAFVTILSQLTGADIAASDDLTGNAALGGNWTLEVNTGEIAADLAIRSSTQATYSAVLDSTYHLLSAGAFTQDWSNTGLITANDDWSNVPSMIGYRGDGLTTTTGVDPQTVTAQDSGLVTDVNANQTNPSTFTTGGVAEFEIANPTIALQGSGTADAPYILIHLNTLGTQNIQVSYNLRDIDGSGDNAVSPVALQYRIGTVGSFTNVPSGYVADASTGPNLATLVTPISVILPTEVENQSQVQLRIITTDAVGSDEWIGIDDINISAAAIASSTVSLTSNVPTINEGNSGSFTVSRGTDTSGDLTVNLTTTGSSTDLSSGDYSLNVGGTPVTVSNGTLSVVIPNGQNSITLNMAALQEALGFAEGAETLQLNLASGTGYSIGSNNTAGITIDTNGFIVTNTADSGEGSLRQAIANANAIAGTDTITFAEVFTDATPDTITLSGTELSISGNTTITGTGANLLTLSGNNTSRLFNVASGTTVSLSGLTVASGSSSSSGGGILNAGSLTILNSVIRNNTTSGSSSDGGAIYNLNTGVLTLQNSTVRNNTATDDGGGIRNDGILSLLNSTISNNTAIGSSVTSGGGGLINVQGGNAIITNSTISGNTARNGGAIRNDGTLSLFNSTITNNTATLDVGGLGNSFNPFTLVPIGTATIQNSIIAGNIDAAPTLLNLPDVGGGTNSFTDSGNNIIGALDGFNSSIQPTTQWGSGSSPFNPLLAALGDYGGPTETHALLPGSRAIDTGNAAGSTSSDQRGIIRVGAVDIGAFESRGFSVAIVSGNNQVASPGAAFANPLVVSVSSSFNEPINGGIISFTAPGSGASTNPAINTATIASAQASALVTANNTAGSYLVSTGGNGIAIPANFNLRNNAPPTSANNSVTLAEDTAFAFNSGDFPFGDSDGGSLTTVRITQLPVLGQLFLDGNGNGTQEGGEAIILNQVIPVASLNQLSFRPAPDANGNNYASFQFQVSDGFSFSTVSYTMSLNVTEVNDAPVASNDSLSDIAEDSGIRIIAFADLLGNDSAGPNEAGQALTITAVSNVVGGTAMINGNNIEFTPTANYNGPASFTYTVQDNGTTNSVNDFRTATGTASFTITEVNDAPVASNDSLSDIAEDSGIRIIAFADLLGNDSAGPNEAGQALTITAVSNVVGGTAMINGNNIEFTPTANYNGPASFEYTVQDNGTTNGINDFRTATTTASFTITSVNDAPVLDTSGNPALPSVRRDDRNSGGSTIADLIASLGGTGITDIDSNPQRGIALVGADSTSGTWQYSLDGGTNWTTVGNVSETQALLLNDSPTTRLRFVPNGTFAGTIANAITFRAWDQTTGNNGTTANITSLGTGGSSAFSTATETASIQLTQVSTLFWRNDTTGETLAWILNGSSYSTFVALPSPPPSWFIANKSDYDNDGDTDLLWRNRVTGETVIWVMNDASFSTFTALPTPNLNWTIAAVDNFDADSDREILWRNVATGENLIWQMNGTSYSSFNALPSAALGWNIIQVTNFDTDPDREILWRNNVTGETVIWQMNGSSYSTFNLLPTAPALWSIVSVDNFDADTDQEILWRNNATGETVIWQMNGSSYSTFNLLPTAPALWSIVSVDNFDADTDQEILWRNSATGETVIWQMNGSSYSTFNLLPTAPAIWSIADTRDYDGDGDLDLLWHNSSTGQMGIWELNNGSYSTFTALPTPASSWRIV